ncbi:MAG: 30S ribosomal protein S1 [Clostridiales bacterium]|nr:30S ribosomal protein S1 [Clostridiales bacterium]
MSEDMQNKTENKQVIVDETQETTEEMQEITEKTQETTEEEQETTEEAQETTEGAQETTEEMQEITEKTQEITEKTQETTEEAQETTEEIQETTKEAQETMTGMLDEIEKSMVQLHNGDIVKGKVISVNDSEILVNVSYKSDGIITRDEMSSDATIAPSELVSEGDEIEVYVLKVNDGEGNVLLSKKRVEAQSNWAELVRIYENDEILVTKGLEAVNGGLITISKGVRCFIPASLLSNTYVEDLNEYIGESLNVQIIEMERKKNRIILSRKPVLEKEKQIAKCEALEKLEKGQRIKGKVRNIVAFGAFVDLGGIDGLIYISELSWSRIKHPSELLSVGDEIEVEIIDIDKSTEKISLSLKQLQPRPWDIVKENYKIGDIITGKVVRIVDFGAFVEVIPGVDGLVHISEISHDYIEKPTQVLKVEQEVNAKILDINIEKKRISLSISKTIEIEIIKNVKPENSEETEKPVEDEYTNNHSEVTIADIVNNNHENK